jgi:hypothetical protein
MPSKKNYLEVCTETENFGRFRFVFNSVLLKYKYNKYDMS